MIKISDKIFVVKGVDREDNLKERVFLNQSRQIFEELLLTRWEYHCDPDFEINEDTGEYEDELVHMAWVGYYLAWNKWSK